MNAYGTVFKKQLLVVLLVLAAIAGSLLVIFTFLATMSFGESLGVVLFLMVTTLLIAGYMLGFIVVAFLAISLLSNYWLKRSK